MIEQQNIPPKQSYNPKEMKKGAIGMANKQQCLETWPQQ